MKEPPTANRADDIRYRVAVNDAAGRALLERYLRRRRTELPALREALAAGDYERLRRIGHNLHGSGAAYDLPRISRFGEHLENAAERRDTTALTASIVELEGFLASIVVV